MLSTQRPDYRLLQARVRADTPASLQHHLGSYDWAAVWAEAKQSSIHEGDERHGQAIIANSGGGMDHIPLDTSAACTKSAPIYHQSKCNSRGHVVLP